MEISGTHQAEVARRMNIRPQSLNQYVQNRRSRPSLEWLLHFLQVNGAFLAITFPTTGEYRNIVVAAAELSTTPLSWDYEFASQSPLPLEAGAPSVVASATNLGAKLESKLGVEEEGKSVGVEDGE